MLKGVNLHHKGYGSTETNYLWNTFPRVIDAVWACGIKAVRFDCSCPTTDATVPVQTVRVNTLLGLCRDRGIKTQMAFISPFKYSRTEEGNFTDDAAGRYAMGYQRLKAMLQACTVKPDYIELENEITLNVSPALAWNQGQVVGDYETTQFLEYVDVLKGELAAAREVAPLAKVIVGTVQGNYGFIPWLLSKGVTMDIAGYHIYYRPSDNLNNWFTLGRTLPNVFTDWGLPVSINELNGNSSLGQPVMGQQAKRAIDELSVLPQVESIFGYELFDSIVQPGFGLCDLGSSTFSVRSNQADFVGSLRSV